MSPVLPALVLAALGAACFALAAALQHGAVGATATDPSRGRLTAADLRALLVRPRWLTGLALAMGGSGLHATALVLAPLAVVQPVGVLAVPIAVLLAARRRRRRPGGGVVAGVALCVVGVTCFVGLTAGAASSVRVAAVGTAVACVVVAVLVALLAAVAFTCTGRTRCLASAMAGASAFGLVSALTRSVAGQLIAGAGPLGPAVLGGAAGIAVALLVGGWFVQQAYVSGPPEAVVAVMTVVDPLVAVLIGVVLLGEASTLTTAVWALLGVFAVTAGGGVLALTRHHPDVAARRSPEPATS